jgi:ABC-2 type transport system permease protein
MTFRANFLIDTLSSFTWLAMNLGFYVILFRYTQTLGTGWGKYEFFLFLATSHIVNSVIQALFMANADEFSELIRTGSLDFALLKPIDTQFLISLRRIDWSACGDLAFGMGLFVYSMVKIGDPPSLQALVLYPFFLLCGVLILYSLMLALAASSVWLGRNQTLYDFWFYITNFSRYPREIYEGRYGTPLRWFFTFIIPVLVVINVPARFLVNALAPKTFEEWLLPLFAVAATVLCLLGSRWIFHRALGSYRSASS